MKKRENASRTLMQLNSFIYSTLFNNNNNEKYGPCSAKSTENIQYVSSGYENAIVTRANITIKYANAF